MLRSIISVVLGLWLLRLPAQSPAIRKSSSEAEGLLAKTEALYDIPFKAGLISFSCAVDFDFEQHVRANFGDAARTANPLVPLLKPIRYRVFVDHSGAMISAQDKLPDFAKIPVAAQVEESNRNLMQVGLNNWVPYALGEVLPIAPTKYQFEKTEAGYNLTMDGPGLRGKLVLDRDLRLVNGVIDTSQHIEITTQFVSAPKGLVLAESSTNTDHAGLARFAYTYQEVDGFQLPQRVVLTSEPNQMTLNYTLTECKTQHGIVLQVAPPGKP